MSTQYCNKATQSFAVITHNPSVSRTAWPYRYCRCHTLSDSGLPAFTYSPGKCDFSLAQFLSLCLYQVVHMSFYTLCISLQIYPFFKITESTLVTWEGVCLKFTLSSSSNPVLPIRGLCSPAVQTNSVSLQTSLADCNNWLPVVPPNK